MGITDVRSEPDPSYAKVKGRMLHLVAIDHREAYYDSINGTTAFAKRKLDRLYYSRGTNEKAIRKMIGVDSIVHPTFLISSFREGFLRRTSPPGARRQR